MSGGRRVERGARRRPTAEGTAAGRAGGRRSEGRAPRRGRGPARGAPLVALLPLAALLLVLPVALVAPGDDTDPPRSVPVRETSYACAAAPTVLTGQVTPGGSAAARVVPGGDEVDDAVDPDRWVRSDLRAAVGRGDRSLVVTQRGTGAGAVGFAAGVLGAASGDGLVVGRCPGVVDDAWFAGLGSAQDRAGSLVLTNLADTPAVVDVTLWSADGPVDAVGGDGLLVDPGTTRTVPLADLAAGESTLGVHVSRRRGSVAVAALDTSTGAAQGSELVGPAPSASRTVVVAGLPSGRDTRTLTVLNPGTSTVRARVEVLGPDGPFVPEGLDEVRVRAGSVTSVELPSDVGRDGVSVRVRATGPVVASATAAGADDFSTLEQVGAWSGSAVVPVGEGLGTPELVVSTPGDRGRRLVLEARGPDQQVEDRAEVTVGAGATLSVDLARELDLDGATSVVVRSGGGVVGSATYRVDGRQAALALTAAPVEVLTPRVRPAP